MEQQPLTKRQREIFEFIQTFIREHGYAPTHRDMEYFGQPNSVAGILRRLEEKGWIKRDGSKSRAMTILVADPEPAKQKPFGEHPDGSLTLCPESAAALRNVMRWRGSRGLPHDHNADIEKLAEVIWETQGIEFEQLT